ncbi:hypothetical protein WMY93_016687 [Mugilogobius chulae]|uniref:Uncharacterized protein n=1 Tax=Mugilogobius chulae TaxID=88201 RepID=A0AAW0NKZ3_9GOBI
MSECPVGIGVGSRSQVNLELTSHSADSDRPASGASPAKEDSSPDSNLTLESDSSGIFLSLSNQSQEEAGSDSDQPISGSDLGSSSTSLDKDGEDGLKEWGREESAELQWCYPTLLNTSMQDENDGSLQTEECKISTNIPIITPPIDQTTSKDQEIPPPRKKVTVMGGESPLCRSPINQSIKYQIDPSKKPIRTSGLDCGDIDPFAQSDSFVYLAVSARPSSHADVTAMLKGPGHEFKREPGSVQAEVTTQLSQSKALQEMKGTQLVPQKPEEGDFLCTDSFVYLAAPACLLLGPPGTTGYSGRDSDSESSDSARWMCRFTAVDLWLETRTGIRTCRTRTPAAPPGPPLGPKLQGRPDPSELLLNLSGTCMKTHRSQSVWRVQPPLRPAPSPARPPQTPPWTPPTPPPRPSASRGSSNRRRGPCAPAAARTRKRRHHQEATDLHRPPPRLPPPLRPPPRPDDFYLQYFCGFYQTIGAVRY